MKAIFFFFFAFRTIHVFNQIYKPIYLCPHRSGEPWFDCIHILFTDLYLSLLPLRYTIKLSHGNFCWEIRRRYKHFLKLDAELFLHRVNHDVRHAARRQSRHLQHLPSRHLPKRPDMFATTQKLEKRKKCLEKYLQTILDNSNYLNHKETLYFLEVSPFSFQRDLGDKGRQEMIFFSFFLGIPKYLQC